MTTSARPGCVTHLDVNRPFFDAALAGSEMSRIATLGPPGTSSEAAARELTSLLLTTDRVMSTQLHSTYESAALAVLTGEADLLVVANAYANVATFYMDTALRLVGAFIFRTPEYGIAVPRGCELPERPRVATHPAPIPLIAQLMPADAEPVVVTATSTSAAALAARAGDVDGALTTKVAAELYDLQFVSPTRPIEMLWSVFRASVRTVGFPADDDDRQASLALRIDDRLGGVCA